jgi:hypothetical protein
VPRFAATRNRGSRLSRWTQLWFAGAGIGVPSRSVSSREVSACQRPYSGGVMIGSAPQSAAGVSRSAPGAAAVAVASASTAAGPARATAAWACAGVRSW